MSDPRDNPHPHRQSLSDFMDGAATPAAAADLCAAWRDSPQARADWHAYHLIGDVLRSDELATRAELDERFLVALRQRLAGEPVVIAPAAPVAETLPFDGQRAAPVRRRRGWLASAAVAAGFAAVAGVLVVTRLQTPVDQAPVLAAVPPSGAVASGGGVAEGEAHLADGKLIRDARLDRYLAAHKQYGNSSALVVPGGVLQRATTVAPER